MPEHDSIQDPVKTAEKVRSGEYFREARAMYDFTVHDPMAERFLYVFITAVSLLSFVIAWIAADGLYPLRTPVPFIVSANDIVEDLPHIHTLLAQEGEAPSEALLRFMVRNYVGFREEYNIDTFDRNISSIKSQSSNEVFNEFQQAIDPHNPDSPITLYQRHSKRRIDILSSKPVGNNAMEVIYDATVESLNDIKRSRWQANVAFQYSGIILDKDTGKVKPVQFIVTQYRTKRLQDVE